MKICAEKLNCSEPNPPNHLGDLSIELTLMQINSKKKAMGIIVIYIGDLLFVKTAKREFRKNK